MAFQILSAPKEQVKLHQSFIPKSLKLDGDQWARMVLKYWPLDDAAIWAGDEACSTDGAVASGRFSFQFFFLTISGDW
jgi:hypothetical protein